jgi:pyruvate dehydrogenase E2 component (dihydrolipoamide acetyltransferase)
MPQLGETVTEGTILKWAKKVGDTINEDEVLVEISTDKVDTEVPSPAAGTILEILVAEGDTVQVGTPLVVIGEAGEAPAGAAAPAEEAQPEEEPSPASEPEEPAEKPVAAPSPPEKPAAAPAPAEEPAAAPPTAEKPAAVPAPAEEPAVAPAPAAPAEEPAAAPAPTEEEEKPSSSEVDAFFAEPDETEKKPHLLSPVVRKLIRENEVDVSGLTGTGEGGRITRKDVEAYLESGPPAAAKEAPVPSEPAAAPQPEEVAETAPAPAKEEPAEVPAAAGPAREEVELDRLRIRIAENTIKAKQTAAHVWTSVEVDYERVERVRQAHKEEFKAAEGFSLTYLPFIARATLDALRAFPVVNSSFYLEEKKAVFHKKVDLGIAIDLEQGGLVVARVRNADGLRLVGIARDVRDLAEKARSGKLGPDDLSGSTFTITNPGPFGSFISVPIINVPNVAILSTETVTKRPTVVTTPDGQDMIAIRHIGYLGLSWDHRAFDGSTAVLFLQRVKHNLETWEWEQELA